VQLAGVFVGRVEDVRVDTTDYSAIATLRIDKAVRLPEDTFASIKTSGLIGDKYVALLPGAEENYLEPGARITMTESAVDLESLIGKVAFGSINDSSKVSEKATSSQPPDHDETSSPQSLANP
jgi:phospholipid/cholesterol/gamma-HCH transport system substrate-binding protein